MRISDWSSDVCSSDLSASIHVTRSPPGRRRATSIIAGAGSTPTTSHPSLRATASSPVPQPRSSTLFASAARRRQKSKSAQNGRAACREREGQYVYVSGCAVSIEKKDYISIREDSVQIHNI